MLWHKSSDGLFIFPFQKCILLLTLLLRAKFARVAGPLNRKTWLIFLPFFVWIYSGLRQCIGKKLAEMESFMMFSGLLRRFTFRTPPGEKTPSTKGHFGLTYSPSPFPVVLKRRWIYVYSRNLFHKNNLRKNEEIYETDIFQKKCKYLTFGKNAPQR